MLYFSERSDKAPAPRAGVWGWGNVVVPCTPKQKRPPHREAFLVLGCDVGLEPTTPFGVRCGARTHDTQNHNLVLYQLN